MNEASEPYYEFRLSPTLGITFADGTRPTPEALKSLANLIMAQACLQQDLEGVARWIHSAKPAG